MIRWHMIDSRTHMAYVGNLHIGTAEFCQSESDTGTPRPWSVSTLNIVYGNLKVTPHVKSGTLRTAKKVIEQECSELFNSIGYLTRDEAVSNIGTMGDVADMLGVTTQRINILISRYPDEYPKPVGTCKAGNLYWLPEWKGART